MDNQRNIILAVLLTGLILFGWEAGMRYFYPNANKPAPAASSSAAAPAASQTAPATPTREGGLISAADIATEKRDLASALSSGNRVPIEAPGLSGSINLAGGLLDDLTINRHTATLKKADGNVRMFSPAGTPAQHFAQFG
ncbi:MAG: membrane protein insertase YidC, partial [Novosphingobium sp.]